MNNGTEESHKGHKGHEEKQGMGFSLCISQLFFVSFVPFVAFPISDEETWAIGNWQSAIVTVWCVPRDEAIGPWETE